MAGLEETQSIEIITFPEPGIQGDGPERAVAVITAPDEIQAIVRALDTELALAPRALCLEQYGLRFLMANGQVVSFGYACDEGGVFLRGPQSYWREMEVAPPGDFQELIARYMDG